MLAVSLSGCKSSRNTNTNAVSAIDVVTSAADIRIKEKADRDLAIAKAKELWREKLYQEEDLSAGPCLSDSLIPGWVADIAHDPRQEVDNQAENQCAAYRNGTAKHFVELDPQGNLIRAE